MELRLPPCTLPQLSFCCGPPESKPFPFLAIKTKPGRTNLGSCETHLLQYPILTTWRRQGVELELSLLPAAEEAAVWLLASPSPSADGVSNSLLPPASFSENQSWKTITSRCLMFPTTPRSSQCSPHFSDGETDEPDQRKEDLHKDLQPNALEPAPQPPFLAAIPTGQAM